MPSGQRSKPRSKRIISYLTLGIVLIVVLFHFFVPVDSTTWTTADASGQNCPKWIRPWNESDVQEKKYRILFGQKTAYDMTTREDFCQPGTYKLFLL
jgi:hypothetical protein